MKRLWGIRHIRYLYHRYQLVKWWDQVGRHFWLAPSDSDWRHLDDIWEGKS